MSMNYEDLKSEKGMTLVELIIVVVILGTLVAALGYQVIGKINPSKEKIAKIAISEFEGQLLLYSTEMGGYPSEGEGLEALVENTSGSVNWNGPYLKKLPTDPWNKPYVYRFPGSHGMEYDPCSNGVDGLESTEDDVCNWK